MTPERRAGPQAPVSILAPAPRYLGFSCMDWQRRLNQGPGRLAIGGVTVEFIAWRHEPHLPDNVSHRHTFFEVCLLGNYGRGLFIVEGREHEIGPGDLFIARPGVVHQIVNTQDPGMDLTWVSFQWRPERSDTASEVAGLFRAFADSGLVIQHDEDGRLGAMWDALKTTGGSRVGPGWEAQIAALITALLIGIVQSGSDRESSDGPDVGWRDAAHTAVHCAIRYIHDNLNRPLSVEEIADEVHVSPRHLSRIFTTLTGVSPAAYIARSRLDRASSLLLRTAMPIKEVATSVGYPDVHHFTRVFSSRVGRPPGRYRREIGPFDGRKIQNPGDLV